MSNLSKIERSVPRAGLFRWEIGLALLLKIILLTGLWFLIFRWDGKHVEKPDVAARFSLPAIQPSTTPVF
ncbi:MAG: hypothetical protein ABL919_15030 [Methylococcales bacterium]|nr:hypothetical protein [Methylococcaceae bacterium]